MVQGQERPEERVQQAPRRGLEQQSPQQGELVPHAPRHGRPQLEALRKRDLGREEHGERAPAELRGLERQQARVHGHEEVGSNWPRQHPKHQAKGPVL